MYFELVSLDTVFSVTCLHTITALDLEVSVFVECSGPSKRGELEWRMVVGPCSYIFLYREHVK
jgi:hypothetical protein